MRKLRNAVFCTVTLTLGVGLTACQTGSTPSNEPSPSSNSPVTYKIFLNRGEVNYPEDGGEGRKLMLEGLNKAGIAGVDFKVTMTAGQEYFTKLNLNVASGDVPDFFSVDLPTMTKFASQGLIMPLDDLLKKMPNASKYYKEADLQVAKYNGKVYALPDALRPEPFNGQNVNGFVGRLDWLKKVGVSEPQTLDAFYEVLKAFTLNDPDGNGKKDTYGLGGTKPAAFGSAAGFEGIFGAFGVIPSFWVERGGVIKQGMVMPETKQALALLQKWYKEGLIDPEFPVTTDKQLDEKMINSKVGIAGKNAWLIQPTNASFKALQKLQPNAELGIIIPPTGPGGRGWPEQSPGGGGLRAISSKAKDPERLAKLLDWTANDQPDGGFFLTAYGIEGKDYTFDKAANRIEQLTDATALTARGFSNPVQFIKVVDRRWSPQITLDALKKTNDYVIKNALWTTVPAQLDYPDIGKLWEEYFVKIVTGEYSVDKWEEFVQKYYNQGGKEIEQQANAEWKKAKS